MKFNCGPTWQERKSRRENWHKWFAWFPVPVGSGDCRWLETVERKNSYWSGRLGHRGWINEYRAIA